MIRSWHADCGGDEVPSAIFHLERHHPLPEERPDDEPESAVAAHLHPAARRRGRWLLYLLTALLSLSAVAETLFRQTVPLASVQSLQAASAAPQELGPVVLADPDKPLDEPLRLLARAREAYQGSTTIPACSSSASVSGDKLGQTR